MYPKDVMVHPSVRKEDDGVDLTEVQLPKPNKAVAKKKAPARKKK